MSEFIGTKLTMNLGERSYDIIVKSGSLAPGRSQQEL